MLINFIIKEWILTVAGTGLLLTSAYARHFPDYSIREMQVLFILFVLLVTVKGLQHSGLTSLLSKNIEQGNAIPLKLVAMTFFLSMLLTNDVALLVIVPITLALNIGRLDILIILEALAANAGSALTPFGNPQNLFIYWFYNLQPMEFVASIAPFSFIFLVILLFSAFIIKIPSTTANPITTRKLDSSSYIYGILLIVVLLTVLRVLPISANFLVIIYVLLFDRKTLRIDYSLLFSFLFFFGLAENMKNILASEMSHPEHVFLLSALSSQIMSNVPTALLFAKFTDNWDALLWGTNTGGFGSLFGSLANLIAYKFYVSHDNTNHSALFTMKFLLIGYMAFFLSIGLYFTLRWLQ